MWKGSFRFKHGFNVKCQLSNAEKQMQKVAYSFSVKIWYYVEETTKFEMEFNIFFFMYLLHNSHKIFDRL